MVVQIMIERTKLICQIHILPSKAVINELSQPFLQRKYLMTVEQCHNVIKIHTGVLVSTLK